MSEIRVVAGSKYRLRFGLVVVHRWLVQFQDLVPPLLSLSPVLED